MLLLLLVETGMGNSHFFSPLLLDITSPHLTLRQRAEREDQNGISLTLFLHCLCKSFCLTGGRTEAEGTFYFIISRLGRLCSCHFFLKECQSSVKLLSASLRRTGERNGTQWNGMEWNGVGTGRKTQKMSL